MSKPNPTPKVEPTPAQLENRARFLSVNKQLAELRRKAPPPIPPKS